MTVFGLKTSFKPAKKIERIKTLTKEQAAEDFNIYMDALKEIYPGLDNLLTEQEFEKYRTEVLNEISLNEGDLKYSKFYDIIDRTLNLIHDSHIARFRLPWADEDRIFYQPGIIPAWFNDTLVCSMVNKEYEKYRGVF